MQAQPRVTLLADKVKAPAVEGLLLMIGENMEFANRKASDVRLH